MEDILISAVVGIVLGFVGRHILIRPTVLPPAQLQAPPPPQPIDDLRPYVASLHKLTRQRVHFRFANGLQETKTLFDHSLSNPIMWRKHSFTRQGVNSEGIVVYTEQLHGR